MRWLIANEVRSAELPIISHIVLLKMPTKYKIIKTNDFQLVFNFEQMHTVTIFGEHGIMAHIR